MSAATKCRFGTFDGISLNQTGYEELANGDLHSAIGAFAVSSFVEKAGPIRGDYHLQKVGLAFWLLGEPFLAASMWSYAVDQLLHGRITHSDLAGGIESGLLLWYAWRRLGVEQFYDDAETLLRRKSEKSKADLWPGPIARFLLEKLDQEALLEEARRSKSLIPRQESQARFYIGLEAGSRGEREAARQMFEEAVRVASPDSAFLEGEYFLAKWELDHPSTVERTAPR